jgi:hypothetical protein
MNTGGRFERTLWSMGRLQALRIGEPLRVREQTVGYSFWPARKTTRWKLQRRLYVRDPWAILNEAVYRSKGLTVKDRDEALSYIEQAEEYFNGGVQGGRSVKPVLLYYSMLNLAKCLIKTRKPALDMSQARHGLTVTHRGDWAVLGDKVSAKSSSRYVNVFEELMRELEGFNPTFGDLAVAEILPQILPGHRLWTYASQQNEKFLAVDVESYVNLDKRMAWLGLNFDRGEYHHVVSSVHGLIKKSHLPGSWRQVSNKENVISLEQVRVIRYQHRPVDCVQGLFQQLRRSLWYAVTSAKPHRKYYVFVDSHLGKKLLPQWASVYVLFYYLSDLTRYRPHLFDRFLAMKYGPEIENAIDECPRQFLYLMASELLQRDVAPADIVV